MKNYLCARGQTHAFGILAFILLAVSAFATTTVTGNIQSLGTGALTTGSFVRFYLRGCAGNQPRVNGTAVIGPAQGGVFFFDLAANGSGAVSGTIYSTRDSAGTGNGDIECGGSRTAVWYGMVIFSSGKSGPEVAVHARSGTALDISNVTPIVTNPVVTSPTGDGTYARLDGGNQPFFAGITTPSVNKVAYVDGSTYPTVQAAINSFGSASGTVIVPPNYAGPAASTATLPNNVSVWDYSTLGRVRIYVNPTTSPAGSTPGIFINSGPPNFSAVGPAVDNPVMFYGASLNSNSQPTQWGQNIVLQNGNGVAGNLTGYEADVNPTSSAVAAIGTLMVAGGQGQPSATSIAYDCIAAANSVPIAPWKNCFAVDGFSGTAYVFGNKDTSLHTTQAITGSGSPQTVTTNGSCAIPTSKLFVGSIISVDTGGSQEDVTITAAACAGPVFSITGIFSKNHANPTNFTEYSGSRLWDASAAVPQSIPYVWGSIQNYNTSNTPNVLSFGVGDSSGTIRVSEYFDVNGTHLWKGVGTTGYEWLSQAGTPRMFLSDAGILKLSVTTFSGLPACGSNEGAMMPISDSTTVTWGANITGGGANHVLAYCDGSAWTVAAK